MVVKGGKRLSF